MSVSHVFVCAIACILKVNSLNLFIRLKLVNSVKSYKIYIINRLVPKNKKNLFWRTTLLCIVGELLAGGSVALAVGVDDR